MSAVSRDALERALYDAELLQARGYFNKPLLDVLYEEVNKRAQGE